MNEKLIDRGAESPGAVLKAARTAKGLTLADVRDRSGLPISTLSKIENGKMGLSYDKLMKLGSGLGLDIAQLLTGSHREESAPPQFISGRRSVTRKGEEQIAETATYRFGYHAVELLGKAINPMMIDIDARSIEEFGKFTRHAGEEFAYVVEGKIDFHCELYAPTRLNEGDSIYFDAAMGHAYVAVSLGRCRILSICTGLIDHAVAYTSRDAETPRPVRRDDQKTARTAPLTKVVQGYEIPKQSRSPTSSGEPAGHRDRHAAVVDRTAAAAKHDVEAPRQPRARQPRRREIEIA